MLVMSLRVVMEGKVSQQESDWQEYTYKKGYRYLRSLLSYRIAGIHIDLAPQLSKNSSVFLYNLKFELIVARPCILFYCIWIDQRTKYYTTNNNIQWFNSCSSSRQKINKQTSTPQEKTTIITKQATTKTNKTNKQNKLKQKQNVFARFVQFL